MSGQVPTKSRGALASSASQAARRTALCLFSYEGGCGWQRSVGGGHGCGRIPLQSDSPREQPQIGSVDFYSGHGMRLNRHKQGGDISRTYSCAPPSSPSIGLSRDRVNQKSPFPLFASQPKDNTARHFHTNHLWPSYKVSGRECPASNILSICCSGEKGQ